MTVTTVGTGQHAATFAAPAVAECDIVTEDRTPPVLSAEDVRVVLGGVPVLRGVSLTVSPGEAVALLGGNGSGKSTFLRAALGLVPMAHGRLELFGTPVGRFRQWRRVGYVPQRTPGALRGATVGEIVASGRLALRPPFLPATRRDRESVTAALRQVDLLERRRDEMATLSGGQQQRVLIARALVSDPELLVLDEPVAGVDLEHQHVLAGIIENLVTAGRSMLVVLHETGPLGAVIERSVILRHGRVDVADGASGHGHCHPGEMAPPDGEGLLSGSVIGERRA